MKRFKGVDHIPLSWGSDSEARGQDGASIAKGGIFPLASVGKGSPESTAWRPFLAIPGLCLTLILVTGLHPVVNPWVDIAAWPWSVPTRAGPDSLGFFPHLHPSSGGGTDPGCQALPCHPLWGTPGPCKALRGGICLCKWLNSLHLPRNARSCDNFMLIKKL